MRVTLASNTFWFVRHSVEVLINVSQRLGISLPDLNHCLTNSEDGGFDLQVLIHTLYINVCMWMNIKIKYSLCQEFITKFSTFTSTLMQERSHLLVKQLQLILQPVRCNFY